MPRTLAQNAQYIAETIKPAIKSAIEAQGVTVPSTDSFLDYADRIAEIEGGGSGYQLKDLPTGAISTVNDAAPLPLNALKVSVEAWQEGSGDPSPSNIRPIHGWSSANLYDTGVNLWDEETEVGNIDTTTGANSYASNRLRSSNYIAVKGGVAITIVCPTNGRYFEYDANYSYTGNTQFSPTDGYITITPSSDTAYIRFILGTGYGTTYNNDVSINYPSSDTNYHAYQGTTKTVDFGQTLYGAEWDVVNGGMAVDRISVDLGMLNWSYNASINVMYTTLVGIELPTSDAVPVNAIASICKTISANNRATETGIRMYVFSTDNVVYIRDSGYTDAEVFKNAMTGQQLVYKLATPTAIDLSPLSIRMLQGTNNIYADCGEVIEGEYFVDEGAHRYQLYDYIESAGNNRIGTSITIEAGDTITATIQPLSNLQYAWVFLNRGTPSNLGVQVTSGTAYACDGSNTTTSSVSVDGIYSYSVTADSGFVASSSNPNMDILYDCNARLYSLSVNDNFYLPCKRKSDGVFGLWDVVNQAFLTDSAGGNAFVGGNPTGVEV